MSSNFRFCNCLFNSQIFTQTRVGAPCHHFVPAQPNWNPRNCCKSHQRTVWQSWNTQEARCQTTRGKNCNHREVGCATSLLPSAPYWELIPHQVSPGDTGWDVFSLDYHVDGPLATVTYFIPVYILYSTNVYLENPIRINLIMLVCTTYKIKIQ